MDKHIIKYKEGTPQEVLDEFDKYYNITYWDKMMNLFFVEVSMYDLAEIVKCEYVLGFEESRTFKLLKSNK